MDPAAFGRDLERLPDTLRSLAASLEEADRWPAASATRVVMIGMGSSRYAASTVATRLRAAGVDAVAEAASLVAGTPPAADVLAIGISASGETEETIEALARHRGVSTTVALTNRSGSAIERAADSVVAMLAGDEEGGVACRSFHQTLAVLLALEGSIVGEATGPVPHAVRRAAEAAEDLLERRDSWLPPVAEALGEGPAVFSIAPAERLASAEQAALMLREGPRRVADACESGDWLHVDVYLTKPLDYRAMLFAGSRFDGAIMEWMRERRATVVAVGGDIEGAALTVRYRRDADPMVALLCEVLVAELLAAYWWLAAPGGGT
jgi:glutamine---fructose-6-phosphate transaminase (isomerizing)